MSTIAHQFLFLVFPLVISKLAQPSCEHLGEIEAAFKHCDIPFDSLLEVDQQNCYEPC